ncbi:hypothetical protein NDU88_000499 [Pleurodeles waltl]|uniref:Secreted protein n=1 Tax=Pleurodeles waltl TaxID=8319 RepID=A0AAV7UTJ5_PLEWA|nr:hypothetical protein NDU88_000499 [Pleurodeles waltl]
MEHASRAPARDIVLISLILLFVARTLRVDFASRISLCNQNLLYLFRILFHGFDASTSKAVPVSVPNRLRLHLLLESSCFPFRVPFETTVKFLYAENAVVSELSERMCTIACNTFQTRATLTDLKEFFTSELD